MSRSKDGQSKRNGSDPFSFAFASGECSSQIAPCKFIFYFSEIAARCGAAKSEPSKQSIGTELAIDTAGVSLRLSKRENFLKIESGWCELAF